MELDGSHWHFPILQRNRLDRDNVKYIFLKVSLSRKELILNIIPKDLAILFLI